MNKKWLMRSAVLVLLIGASGFSYFLGGKNALESLHVSRVSPDQIARAMRDDRFFSYYRERTLLVTGTIGSVTGNAAGAVLRFRTTTPFAALCALPNQARTPHPGDRVTVIAEGATAERQSSAVKLQDCTLP